jgi:hypothetical protein
MGRPTSGTVGYHHVVDIWSIIRHHDYRWETCSLRQLYRASTGGHSIFMLGSLLSPKWDNMPQGTVTSVFLVEWVVQRGVALGSILMEACVVCAV